MFVPTVSGSLSLVVSSSSSLSTGRALAFRLLALFGIVLSSYALYVEHRVSRQKAGLASEEEGLFVALCDLGTWASCSDVLTSETSRLFGPPNALMGVIFYTAVLLYPSFTFVPFREYLLLAAVSFSCVRRHQTLTHTCTHIHTHSHTLAHSRSHTYTHVAAQLLSHRDGS